MFGGLEIKGGSPDSKQPPAQEGATDSAPAPPGSGFSFLNAAAPAPAAEAEPAAATSSGFSFLNPGAAPAPEPAPPATDAAPAGSGFSFLNSTPATTDATPAEVPEANGTANANTETSSGVLSEVPPMASELAAEGSDGVRLQPLSSFSFLGGGGGADTVSTISRDSPEPSEAGLSIGSNPVSSSGGPMASSLMDAPNPPTTMSAAPGGGLAVGAGVTFGGAMPGTAKVIKKKRGRAARIGTGASATAPAATTPPRVTQPAAEPQPAASTKDAALEAARRAEEFMSEKLKEQAVAAATSAPPSSEAPASTASIGRASTKDYESEDEIVAAARAAAEEAQKQMAKQPSLSDRMGLGGLFGARRSPPAMSPAPAPKATVTTTGHPPAPPVSEEKTVEETPVERLQREQEEAKRAMAQRQLQMLQEHKQEDSGSFQPPAIQEFQPPKPIKVVPVPQIGGSSMPPPPKQIAVPAIKPKTPTDVFKAMIVDFREMVVKSMEEVTRLRQHRNGLLEERFVTLAKERLATQQKAQAEAQQMTAAEAEDFELADRMGTVIESHERERIEFAAIQENIGRALKELDSQQEIIVERVTHCFQEIGKKLKAFQDEQDSKDTEDDAEAMRRFSAVSKQLSTENERLQHDLKHIERDEELIAEERKELESAISDQAGAFESMRDEAKKRLTEVEEEIEELRKQLEAKQKVAAELRTEAAGHEESILKVRVKFSRQLNRVQKKEATVKDNKEEWEMEKKTYDQHREEHEAKVAAHSEALLAREKLLDSLEKEVEMATTFEEIVSKEIGLGISSEKEDGVDDELAQMQADVVKVEAAVSEAKELLKATTAVLTGLEDEVKGLEFRIPVLEETKKSAAARRDFKGAGKASKEIKEASARLAECKGTLINEAKERQAAAEDEVKKLEIQLEEKRKIAHEQERETSIAAMERLADNIKRLVATKKSVCAGATENSIQGVGAFVLDGQIKALRMEGETYGEKYGGWKELMAEVGLEDEEEEVQPSTTNEEDVAKAESTEETSPASEEPSQAVEEPDLSPEAKAAMKKKFRDLTKQLKDTEEGLEKAVADEDFEKAAELDEVLQKILSEVQTLSLSDEEMEAALTEESDDEAESAQPEEVAVAVTEEEDEEDADEATPPSTEESKEGEEKTAVADSFSGDSVDEKPSVDDNEEESPIEENGTADSMDDDKDALISKGDTKSVDSAAVEAISNSDDDL